VRDNLQHVQFTYSGKETAFHTSASTNSSSRVPGLDSGQSDRKKR